MPSQSLKPSPRRTRRHEATTVNLSETGEPSKEVYAALREALARREANKPPVPATEPDPPGWPKAQLDQVKAVQQALLDLNFSRDKPDGDIGPMTRDAIHAFQRGGNLRETGEPTRDVFAALQEAVARRSAPKPGARQPTAAAMIDPGKHETTSTPPPSTDIARAEPKPEPPKADPNAWPATTAEQVSAIQQLLRELNFTREELDGLPGPLTRAAISDYQKSVGLPQTGEPTKELFESLKEMRKLTGSKPN